MRLLLKLRLENKNSQLSANYNYPLAAAVYKLLRFGSPEFAEFLHSVGFKNSNKTYKLFTFALILREFRILNEKFILENPSVDLIISSSLIEQFIQNFIIGTFQEQHIELVNENIKTNFIVEQIESFPNIQFNNKMKFKMLSPLVLSTKINNNSRLQQYYYRYNDPMEEINRVLNINLKNKYEIINNRKHIGSDLKLGWDVEYINKMEQRKKRITKKITVTKHGGLKIDLIGNQLPYTVEGDPELIKIGYECGFGEKNSLGFGLVEEIKL